MPVAMSRLGRGSAFSVLLLAVGLLAAATVVTATTFQVGGVTWNWTVPSTTKNVNYQTWADGQKFKFGDELVFNYRNDSHNVLQVANATAFEACDTSSDDATLEYDSGEDVITLTGGPKYYFICGEPGHCLNGQKFHITVGAYVPAPVIPTTDSPPSGSSRSLPRIGLVLLTVAVVFCTAFA